MARSALRRLMAEYKQLTLNPPEGIIADRIEDIWKSYSFPGSGECVDCCVESNQLIEGVESWMKMFEFPPDWEDDERMAFLFRDFRPREANPLGYDEKMLFWKKLVTNFTRQRRDVIFSVQSLAEKFTRKNSQPVCLGKVVEALQREGVVALRKPPGWTSWMMNWLFPPTNDVEGDVFINVKAVNEAQQDVRMAIKNKSFTETKVALRDVWLACKEACDGNQDLFHLVLERIPQISLEDNHVKFAPGSDLIKPLTEHEKALMKVRETEPRIQEKIDQLLAKEERLIANSVRLKKEGSTQKAISEMRRLKAVRRQLDKLNNILDNFHQIENDLENQRDLPDILESYKVAASALKSVTNEADKVHDIVDELNDAAAEHQEIQESVASGATVFTKDDEDDLEEELRQILQEEEKQEDVVPFLPSVPTEPVAGRGDAVHVNKSEPAKRVRLGYFE